MPLWWVSSASYPPRSAAQPLQAVLHLLAHLRIQRRRGRDRGGGWGAGAAGEAPAQPRQLQLLAQVLLLAVGWVEARRLQDAHNDSDRRAGQQGEGDPITRPGLDLAAPPAAVQGDVAIQGLAGQAADSDLLHAAVERGD